MADGDGEGLVSVALTKDRAEAEIVKGLLESAGIPCFLQSVGVDGPLHGIGWLNPSGGARQVMVRAGHSHEARSLLAQTLTEGEGTALADSASATDHEEMGGRRPRNYGLIGAYARIWAWSLAAMILAFTVFLLLRLAS